MSNLYCMLTIVRRELGEKFITFFRKNGMKTAFAHLCNGTAQQKTLDYLGIEKTEKIIIITFGTSEVCKKVNHDLIIKMNIDVPGNGISITVPFESVGGKTTLEYLSKGQDTEKGEVKNVNNMEYSLITVIAESGNSDIVMDAARSAGARGGTVVHAKGTANDSIKSTFFGVTVAAEKEMIYIVSRKSDRDTIMKAIMEKAGAHTPAKAMVFSLPVDTVVGLRSVTEEE